MTWQNFTAGGTLQSSPTFPGPLHDGRRQHQNRGAGSTNLQIRGFYVIQDERTDIFKCNGATDPQLDQSVAGSMPES